MIGENVAEGMGMTENNFNDILATGVNVDFFKKNRVLLNYILYKEKENKKIALAGIEPASNP